MIDLVVAVFVLEKSGSDDAQKTQNDDTDQNDDKIRFILSNIFSGTQSVVNT